MSKILINALQFSSNGAGISRYSHKLSENLVKSNNNIDILCRDTVANEFTRPEKLIEVSIDEDKSSERIIKEQLTSLKFYKDYELVHFLDYATPVLYKGKKLATIHDMAMHTMKDKFTKRQIITKKLLLENTIKHADKLICISKFTANELLHYYPNIDNSKIEVVYNGFEYKEINLNSKIITSTLDKFKIKKDYLLFVGTLSPHKNVKRIVEAFNELKKQGYDYNLVICGKKGWLYDDIFSQVKYLNLENEVIFTGYVTDEELEVLYRNTKLFVFPSLYEGFGFPPIEAMARKVPVLTSKEGALPEIVGDAAVFCDAYDVNDIASKIVEIIENEKLKKSLIQSGLERIKYFSWENTCMSINKIYDEVLRNGDNSWL